MITELHDCFDYVECDIPAGMTIAAWKRERADEPRHAHRASLRQLLAASIHRST